MERVLLTNWRSPGDIVCMTACVRDLALSHPGRYEIHVGGFCPALWQNNPHVAKLWGPRLPQGIPTIRLNCVAQLAESSRVMRHYITAFHHKVGQRLDIDLPVQFAKGDLNLSEEERCERIVAGNYWLVVAGGKADIPLKIWSAVRFQELLSSLRRRGIKCVQGGALLPGHRHPALMHVDNLCW